MSKAVSPVMVAMNMVAEMSIRTAIKRADSMAKMFRRMGNDRAVTLYEGVADVLRVWAIEDAA